MAGKGWTWTWQRCGRYKYKKLLVRTTNPDHLAASTPSLRTSRPYGLPTGTRAGARVGDDDRRYHGQAGRTWMT